MRCEPRCYRSSLFLLRLMGQSRGVRCVRVVSRVCVPLAVQLVTAPGHETTDHLPDAFCFCLTYNNGDQIKNQREAPHLTSLLFLTLCNM